MSRRTIPLTNASVRCDECGRPVLLKDRLRVTYADGGLVIAVEHRRCPIVLNRHGRTAAWGVLCALAAAAVVALTIAAARVIAT